MRVGGGVRVMRVIKMMMKDNRNKDNNKGKALKI